MDDELRRGLEGVVVDETTLSDVDGSAGRLVYRGYEIGDLAESASFEEVLYLLWHERLPTRDELADFRDALAADRALAPAVQDLLADLAEAGETPMAALRTAVSALSATAPSAGGEPQNAAETRERGRRIAAKMPTILAAYDRLRRGERPIPPDEEYGHAADFLRMLTGHPPDEVAADTFDMALTLHADHGFNASTFVAITVASTFADIYSAAVAGVGALSGPLHGGANQDGIEVLAEIDRAEESATEWARNRVEAGEHIPGWGHRVYEVTDPRAEILRERLGKLSAADGDRRWLEYTRGIETHLTGELSFLEKGIAPNVDFYSGAVYHKLGIPEDMYTPIFAMSRVGGWVGHVLEYQATNRLIRPRARYVGPADRAFVPIDQR
ncbi:citrate synthase [Halobacteriales archaeon QH_10_67_13]|nr:MAG: citrate synthase [Halobacteriales archaeon QH_10_67_13]